MGIIGLMLLLMMWIGWLLGGVDTLYVMLGTGILFIIFAPRLMPQLLIRRMGAKVILPRQSPLLFDMVQKLVERSGLNHFPTLYHLPTPVLNAFSTGLDAHVSLVISDGLLRALDGRELAAVLAHEISHIRHKDIWVMMVADLFSQMTWTFCLLGQVLILINLPLWVMHKHTLPWGLIFLLLVAPSVSMSLQLVLSRTREFEADRGAMELTHDPQGLASALRKMEEAQEQEMKMAFPKLGRVVVPSWLRTHPQTKERIRRLFATARPLNYPEIWAWDHGISLPMDKGPPRWRHLSGFRW
ncbi:zinc metalloprotease HtpX [Acidithiobacillus sp. M4-SHS-6]|uniref:zinc metalloprotease HtpX n=1 Tax=Acidithiobacillus sp. M4-SHS-6 TaxID=3383024 RepID=UPI0039BE2381